MFWLTSNGRAHRATAAWRSAELDANAASLQASLNQIRYLPIVLW